MMDELEIWEERIANDVWPNDDYQGENAVVMREHAASPDFNVALEEFCQALHETIVQMEFLILEESIAPGVTRESSSASSIGEQLRRELSSASSIGNKLRRELSSMSAIGGRGKESELPAVFNPTENCADHLEMLIQEVGLSEEAPIPVSDANEYATKKLQQQKTTIDVHCHVIKVGEIDTVGERFSSELVIYSRWREPALNGKTKLLNKSYPIWNVYWNPALFVSNAFSSTKETISYRVHFDADCQAIVEEVRHVRGVFSETLELYDFPFDVQELTVKLTTTRQESEVEFRVNADTTSVLNVESFGDRQQWTLTKKIKLWNSTMSDTYSREAKKHPVMCLSCKAKRRAEFFIWNIMVVMVCICSMSFTTFTISCNIDSLRLSLSFILLLSNVTFKFTVSKAIPKVSYLTYMDKYIIVTMLFFCLVSAWHAIIATINADYPDLSNTIDKAALGVFAGTYVAFNVIFAIILSNFTTRHREKRHKRKMKQALKTNKVSNAEEVGLKTFSETNSE